MFEKEAEEKAEEYANKNVPIDTFGFRSLDDVHYDVKQAFLAGLEYNNKQIAELEEKISVLLSCKNCPENKGGWICVKEYENKCLAQKIEFIKELEKEKCELLGIIQGKDKVIQELEKENAELKAFKQDCIKLTEDNVVMAKQRGETAIQLTKAKEIIKDYMTIIKGSHTTVCGVPEENRTIYVLKLNEEAEQFLKE